MPKLEDEIPDTQEGLRIYIRFAEKEEQKARTFHRRILKLLNIARRKLDPEAPLKKGEGD